MGTPIREPTSCPPCECPEQGIRDWYLWPPRERVSIDLDVNCLRRLLKSRQLQVQDFSCADASSKESVRRLLLQTLTQCGTAHPRWQGKG